MQASRQLLDILARVAGPERAVFAFADLRAALPEHSRAQFKVVLSRMVKRGELERVCRGIYYYPQARMNRLLVLPHTAARLRAGHFLYLSLESMLSEYGIISQIPMDRLTLMTNGRTGVIDCGDYGVIEYTHTKRGPADCQGALQYDARRRLWLASPQLAWRDLRFVGRNLDLVDQAQLAEQAHAVI